MLRAVGGTLQNFDVIVINCNCNVQSGAAGSSAVNPLVENCQSKRSIASTTWLWFLSCIVGIQFIPSSRRHDAAVMSTNLVRLNATR